MEEHKRKPIIIEFNGLPGSGKTTTANLIRQLLTKEGIEVSSRYYKKNIHQKAYTILADPKYWKLYVEVFSYCNNLPFSERLHYTFSIVGFIRMYRNFTKSQKSGILLIDQGIIQLFISVAFKKQLGDQDKLIRIFNSSGLCDLPLLIVNCNVKVSVSSERIEKRPPKNCRADSLDERERIQLLSNQEKNFSIIRSVLTNPLFCFNYISVNTENPLEENANIIISEFNRLF